MARGLYINYKVRLVRNQNDLFDDFTRVFSSYRLEAYLKRPECKNKLDALAAYCWNVKLSQAFYPALQVLEIALRLIKQKKF